MKKLFLLPLLMLILSCGDSTPQGEISPMIVISVKNTENKGVVRYEVSNTTDFMGFDIRYFNDSINKFNVGDRIEFQKVK